MNIIPNESNDPEHKQGKGTLSLFILFQEFDGSLRRLDEVADFDRNAP
jgi:hypothetical protein